MRRRNFLWPQSIPHIFHLASSEKAYSGSTVLLNCLLQQRAQTHFRHFVNTMLLTLIHCSQFLLFFTHEKVVYCRDSDLASTTSDRRPPTAVKYIWRLLFKLIIVPSLKNFFSRKWKLFCWFSPTTTPAKLRKVKNFPHADHLFMGELIVLMDHFYLWSCYHHHYFTNEKNQHFRLVFF